MINIHKSDDKFSYVKDHLLYDLDASPISIYLKDQIGRYLFVNQSFLNIFQQSSDKHVIGFSDFDFFTSSCSQEFKTNDNTVITTENPMIIVECNKFLNDGKERYYLSHKMPLRSRTGKVIGIIGQSIQYEQSDTNLLSSIFSCGYKIPFDLIDYHSINRVRIKYQLTKRQTECIYHLSKGKTKKEIANHLNLSVRTIETFWNQIKNKLNCNSRSHLIEILNKES